MTTNRRGFIASLLVLPTAAVAAIKSKPIARKPLKGVEYYRIKGVEYYRMKWPTLADYYRDLKNGTMTVNQARSLHGLPPLPDSIVVIDDPLTSGEIRNICYAFNVPPSQLL